MSKNLTRKGLAFGALVALVSSGFAGLPASAVGNDGNVRLAPATGAEYDVRSNDFFDFAANFSNAAKGTGEWLKYRIEDSGNKTSVALGQSEQYTYATSAFSQAAADDKVTLTTASGNKFKVGDKIAVTANDALSAAAGSQTSVVSSSTVGGASAEVATLTVGGTPTAGNVITILNAAAAPIRLEMTADAAVSVSTAAAAVKVAVEAAAGSLYTVSLNAGVATFTAIAVGARTLIAATVASTDPTKINIASATVTDRTDTTVSYIGGLRSANQASTNDVGLISLLSSTPVNGVYIYDTKSDSNSGSDRPFRLKGTNEDVTQTATVTAWIDTNDNGLIDSSEYTSPSRTVRFLKASDITATTTIRPATVGDTNVTADVVLTPTLNGLMVIANEGGTSATNVTNIIAKVNFTRQGDVTALTGATAGSYSNTSKTWTFTSINLNQAGWADTHASKPAQRITANALANDTASYSITNNVATIVTGAPHGFRVGDFVIVSASGATRLDTTTSGGRLITAVPSTTSLSYAVEVAQQSVTNVASTALVAADKLSAGVLLRDSVEAGNITAQFYLDANGSGDVAAATPTAAQTVGTLATFAVGSKVVGASGLAIEGVASATVSAAGSVFTGTTAASALVRVTDVDGDPVGAGVDVTILATKVSPGTVTVNGVTIGTSATRVAGKTDASGVVTLAIANSSALAGQTLALTANSQGATASRTLTWEGKKYTLHDLADVNADNSVRSRVVASGVSYTFNLLAQDQFKQPAGADVRLLVTTEDRTVSQNIVPLTAAGTATVVVADGGLTGTFTDVKIGFQKLTNAVWATQSGTDAFQDWNNDAAEEDDLAKVVINYDSTADALTLNANGANFPGNGTADNAAAVAVAALKAIDLRNTAGVAAVYTAAQTGNISGQVTNTFGVAKPGSMVTVSGTGLLFNVGDVWALNSVSLLANATGQFSVNVFASTGGAKVVTATVGSVSKTFTITYTGIAGDATLVVTTPANVMPASTFQVKAKIADSLGNGLDTAAGRVKVTYTGAGIVFGTLPTETDANGELQFSVLLGANDSSNISVTVSYDQNGDGDYVDAKDLNVTKTIMIGAAAVDQKVNVGSFKGFVALYAKGYEGQRMSAIVAGKWIQVASLDSDFERVVRFTGAGFNIDVKIYIDGKQVGSTFKVLTK